MTVGLGVLVTVEGFLNVDPMEGRAVVGETLGCPGVTVGFWSLVTDPVDSNVPFADGGNVVGLVLGFPGSTVGPGDEGG